METKQAPKPAFPLVMLLAAPAYADEGSLLLERRGGRVAAARLFVQTELHQDGQTRVVEAYHNPFAEQLAGVYLHRLPENVVVERLTFTLRSEDGGENLPPIAAYPALFTLRTGAALVERTAQIGPGETLLVELEYRTRSPRRVLALREAVRGSVR